MRDSDNTLAVLFRLFRLPLYPVEAVVVIAAELPPVPVVVEHQKAHTFKRSDAVAVRRNVLAYFFIPTEIGVKLPKLFSCVLRNGKGAVIVVPFCLHVRVAKVT